MLDEGLRAPAHFQALIVGHLGEACLLADNAVREAARTRQLRDKGFVSEDRVDRAESEAKARQAGCESARAQGKEAEARIAASRADTARTVMRAPFAGTIAALDARMGEHVGIGSPMVRLADLTTLQIETDDLTELSVVRVVEGASATVTFDALPGLTAMSTPSTGRDTAVPSRAQEQPEAPGEQGSPAAPAAAPAPVPGAPQAPAPAPAAS